MKYLISLAMLLPFNLCHASDPEVVPRVDYSRYMGLWYQVAHFPSFFLNSCDSSTAEYTLNQDSSVGVFNTCYKDKVVKSTIRGTARAPNAAEPAKLKVDFGFFAKGDYWIVDLADDYQWAVVSGPGKSSLFILSRQAPMDAVLLSSLVQKLKQGGFDVDKIIFDVY